MKKNIYLSIIFIITSFCNAHAEANVFVDYCPEYYNPFAWSFKWHLKYSEMLEKNKKVKITFYVNNSETHSKISRWEHVLGNSQTECYVYLFLQDNFTGKHTLRIDVVPCDKSTNSWIFNHHIETSHELVFSTYQTQFFPMNKAVLLAKLFEQLQGKTNLPDVNMFYKKFTVLQSNKYSNESVTFLSLEVFCLVTLVDINDKVAGQEISTTSLSDIPFPELLQLKEKLEKEFQQGKGILSNLNAVQKEINVREKQEIKNISGK